MKIPSPHRLNPVQRQVLNDQNRMLMYSGGYACGKTLMGCYWVLKKSSVPDSIGNVMAPTFRMIWDNILQKNLLPLLDYFSDKMGYKIYTYKQQKDKAYIQMGNGAIIRFRPFDDETKLRGPDLSWIWLDEAIGKDRIFLTKSRFEQIRARCRQGNEQQFLVTTNPGAKSSFLYDYFVASKKENRSMIYGSIYDNKHLGEDYIKDMATTFTKEELMGKWVRNAGVIYAAFDRELHVSDKIEEDGLDYYLTIDFGSDNPFACLLIGVDYDNTIYALDEIFGAMLTIDAIPLIQDMIGNRTIHTLVCDTNSPDGVKQLDDEFDFLVQSVKFKHKMVNAGIRMVKNQLKTKADGTPRLIIHPKCINLIGEFESYIWDRDKDEYGKDRPVKKNDHALDALRYFTTYHNM